MTVRPESQGPDAATNGLTARQKVDARLPGFRKILVEMRDSGDPDRIADGAFILGLFGEIADVGAEMVDRLHDAAAVIERMANGASRQECSPELDRVIAALREIDGDEEDEMDELQRRADEIAKGDLAVEANRDLQLVYSGLMSVAEFEERYGR